MVLPTRRAQEAVRRLRGITGVTNSIQIKPGAAPMEIRRKIEEALQRAAEIDASRITVEANCSEVILRGTVRSWAERQDAERPPGGPRAYQKLIIASC